MIRNEDDNYGVGQQITRMIDGQVTPIRDRKIERRARMIWERDIPALEKLHARYVREQTRTVKKARATKWTHATTTTANAELAAATLRVIASIRETSCP